MKLLKTIWKKWLNFGHIIGNFQGQVIFTLFYYLILFPVGFGVKFFSDPLNLRIKNKKSNFNSWEHPEEDVEMARKPY